MLKKKWSLLICLVMGVFVVSMVYAQSTRRKSNTTELKRKIQAQKLKKKKERETAIKRLRKKLSPIIRGYSIEELQLALLIKVTTKYTGCKIYATDTLNNAKIFLGTIENEFASNSIFNEFGSYGSPYATNSIWNEYGSFGGEYSAMSPFNSYSATPPVIVKNGKIIGRLSTNKYTTGAIDPNWLKTYFKY